jgi:hypothetical protein
MPSLRLLNDGSDQSRIFACMYFPSDEARRDELFRELVEPLEDNAAAATAPSRKQGKEFLRIWGQAWRAAMAGEALLCVAAMDCAGMDEPSVGKAFFALSSAAKSLRDDDGRFLNERPFNSISVSEKSYLNYWADYKSVAHFWAAHRVLEQAVPFVEIPDALTSDAEWRQFLGWSEWFLQFGCQHASRNMKAGHRCFGERTCGR